MPLNPYFNFHGQIRPNKEWDLYRRLHQEVTQIHGMKFLYCPRETVNMDRLFGEDLSSKFSVSYELAAWIETFDGFQGDGDLISKFGLHAHDELIIVLSGLEFKEVTGMDHPRDGDLLYCPLTNEIFDIKFVEHQQQFYPLGAQMSFKLRCETLEISREKIDTPELVEAIGSQDLQEKMEDALPYKSDNVLIQEEASAIIDWTENSPFGEY